MKTSPQGILEICEHEGIVPAPYKDSVGVWTYGIGHTAAAGGIDPSTMNRAMPSSDDQMHEALVFAVKLLSKDLEVYEADVNQAIRVPLEQHQFDALVSFHYNTGGIHRARLTKAINAGEADAARHFMGWLKPPEIRGRRTAEMRLFETGDYAANGSAIAVWGTNGQGKLTKPVRTVSGDWILSVLNMKKPAPKAPILPPEAEKVIRDADKTGTSKINWTAIFAGLSGAWQTFQSADWRVQLAGLAVVAFAVYIIFERNKKSRLAREAKRALGL